MDLQKLTVLYFGIYNRDFSRNKIYIQGLRKIGVTVIECQDQSSGISKYWHLFLKHWKVRGTYDALIVGYPGHIVVPFARLLTKKPVISDLLGSLEDAEIYSHSPSLWKRYKAKIADFLAVTFSDIVLLESDAQKSFFVQKFGHAEKYKVVYTGVDDAFEYQEKVHREKFTVLFRGRLTPESGIRHILNTAEILKSNPNILFRIVGGGQLLLWTQKEIRDKDLTNVELISEYLSPDKFVMLAGDADLSLGQMENNPRLSRTIPHKAFESFALGVPYLTGNAPAISELVREGETGFLTPLADAEKLADKIAFLSTHPDVLDTVARNARKMFKERLFGEVLATRIKDSIKNFALKKVNLQK